MSGGPEGDVARASCCCCYAQEPTATVEDGQRIRRPGHEPPSVRRPGELLGTVSSFVPLPEAPSVVDVDDANDSSMRHVREDVPLRVRTPGPRTRADASRHQPVGIAVAVDDPERPAGSVRDAEAARRPAWRDDAGRAGERPADNARRRRGDEARAAGERDVEPLRRPRGVGVGTQPSLGAVGPDDPHAAARHDKEPALGRKRGERGPGVLAPLHPLEPDRLAHPPRHGLAGRAQRGSHDRAEERQGEKRAPRPGTRHMNVLLVVGGADDCPRPPLGVELAGRRRPLEQLRQTLVPHASSRGSRSASSSRPRRRREFTVPRGTSRSRAISPGV